MNAFRGSHRASELANWEFKCTLPFWLTCHACVASLLTATFLDVRPYNAGASSVLMGCAGFLHLLCQHMCEGVSSCLCDATDRLLVLRAGGGGTTSRAGLIRWQQGRRNRVRSALCLRCRCDRIVGLGAQRLQMRCADRLTSGRQLSLYYLCSFSSPRERARCSECLRFAALTLPHASVVVCCYASYSAVASAIVCILLLRRAAHAGIAVVGLATTGARAAAMDRHARRAAHALGISCA